MAKMSRNEISRPLKLLMVLGIAIVPILLIILQPDYGSAMAYIVATALMLYVAGIKKRYIISAILLVVIAVPVLYFFVLPEHARLRIDVYLNPYLDPRGAGYNIIQSKLAIGAGRLFGEGWLNVVWTPDMTFYRTRKVRILNGTHTMSVLAAYQTGLNTVEECMKSELVSSFMHEGLFNEIIPSMDGDKDLLVSYAGDVLNRFKNPYIVHLLLSISLNSTSKFKTRDLPSLLGYKEKTGKLPKVLVFSLASLIAFYEGTKIENGALIGNRNGEEYKIMDSPDVLEKFASLYSKDYCCNGKKAATIADEILGMDAWWGMDLRTVEGLQDAVKDDLEAIWNKGMTTAMKELLEK